MIQIEALPIFQLLPQYGDARILQILSQCQWIGIRFLFDLLSFQEFTVDHVILPCELTHHTLLCFLHLSILEIEELRRASAEGRDELLDIPEGLIGIGNLVSLFIQLQLHDIDVLMGTGKRKDGPFHQRTVAAGILGDHEDEGALIPDLSLQLLQPDLIQLNILFRQQHIRIAAATHHQTQTQDCQ